MSIWHRNNTVYNKVSAQKHKKSKSFNLSSSSVHFSSDYTPLTYSMASLPCDLLPFDWETGKKCSKDSTLRFRSLQKRPINLNYCDWVIIRAKWGLKVAAGDSQVTSIRELSALSFYPFSLSWLYLFCYQEPLSRYKNSVWKHIHWHISLLSSGVCE